MRVSGRPGVETNMPRLFFQTCKSDKSLWIQGVEEVKDRNDLELFYLNAFHLEGTFSNKDYDIKNRSILQCTDGKIS